LVVDLPSRRQTGMMSIPAIPKGKGAMRLCNPDLLA
jgi:hypothetical protein